MTASNQRYASQIRMRPVQMISDFKENNGLVLPSALGSYAKGAGNQSMHKSQVQRFTNQNNAFAGSPDRTGFIPPDQQTNQNLNLGWRDSSPGANRRSLIEMRSAREHAIVTQAMTRNMAKVLMSQDISTYTGSAAKINASPMIL